MAFELAELPGGLAPPTEILSPGQAGAENLHFSPSRCGSHAAHSRPHSENQASKINSFLFFFFLKEDILLS